MSAARNLADVLRAVAERVERGETFPEALREVASELEAQGGTPAWHLEIIDKALAENDDIAEPWEQALEKVRDEITRA